ncbi:hypothetical protein TREPR_1000 [Treponema primitia ZAS-2]|uniref:Ribosome association toxin RatA n=1 Tax=Treponema primitia (strain ATCC BAA-887 / DSM 12427 / ZAS-2) TaxID=545694 RepID=F5YHS2_TREPZ|nr:hypothetical protein [Treponema primitia]AEF84846.1 hypothetical protein TREPR_1000 [Treponema primitia ZAS-2]
MKKMLPALFLLGLSRLFAQEADIELPDQEVLEKIYNKPGIIKTEVSQEKGDDNLRWVEMYTDIHITTDIPMDKLRRTILEFNNYPRIFRRNQGVTVIWEDDSVYLDMTVGATLLGISFLTKYRVSVTELFNSPEEFVLDFSHVSDDGNVKDVYGRWYLKKIPLSAEGEQRFYVRYYASSKVIRKYPFLRMIMAMFINSESRDLMNQFLKTAGEM